MFTSMWVHLSEAVSAVQSSLQVSVVHAGEKMCMIWPFLVFKKNVHVPFFWLRCCTFMVTTWWIFVNVGFTCSSLQHLCDRLTQHCVHVYMQTVCSDYHWLWGKDVFPSEITLLLGLLPLHLVHTSAPSGWNIITYFYQPKLHLLLGATLKIAHRLSLSSEFGEHCAGIMLAIGLLTLAECWLGQNAAWHTQTKAKCAEFPKSLDVQLIWINSPAQLEQSTSSIVLHKECWNNHETKQQEFWQLLI